MYFCKIENSAYGEMNERTSSDPHPWLIINWTLGNKIQGNLYRMSYISIQENAIENIVCQIGSHFVEGKISEDKLANKKCVRPSKH